MQYIDDFLNKITMYRLVLFGLNILALVSIFFGFIGILPFSGLSLIISLFTLLLISFLSNYILSKLFSVITNIESAWITGTILYFIIIPSSSLAEFLIICCIAILAMASKYIFAIKKKHIFNPAAISVFIAGLFGFGLGSWWVGSGVMLIPVAILGFLILRKIKRFSLFSAFFIAGFVSIFISGLSNNLTIAQTFYQVFTSWPIFFFGSVMLTEPLTTPPTKFLQIIYGAIVGLLFGTQFQFGPIYSSPALALLIGNIFSYLVSPHDRLKLGLLRKEKLTSDVYNFVWQYRNNKKLNFKAGQYLEWTIDSTNTDMRGNRRYFTIASSPTEENLILGTKFYPKPSTFKQKLLSLEPGDNIIASQLSGEFVLPKDSSKKMVFIAGGIGVTPFRSMAKYLLDKNEKRDIVMFYSNKTVEDIAYKDILDKAKEIGWKTIYVINDLKEEQVSSNMKIGFINNEIIMKELPDFRERIYYISGTHGMVTTFKKTLSEVGISKSSIKTDFFPGFV
jgi:ferredoxin-NADP reductase/Na+-translocating ferredoxin:NAD+ oxidoreductase RnfD subunit